MMVADEQELAACVADAAEPLSVRGGDTRGMAGTGAPLSVAGLSGITLYEPGALTMVVQAGTPVTEVEAALASENQRLAFEPVDHRGLLGGTGTPTVGGIFAANISGPRRIAVGAARDFLLGARFVDGRGGVVKNGGRVMKNVTGYDLVKLMAGSFGTLGVMSELSFKVLPQVETQASLALHGLEVDQAVVAMSRAMGSPFEVSGAAHDPAAGQTILRVEGFEASVAYRVAQLKATLKALAGEMTVLTAADSGAFWSTQRDVAAFRGTDGDVWRVSCKPSDAPALVRRAGSAAYVMDWAGGLIWLRMAQGSDLRARLGMFDGHATIVRADSETKARFGVFHPQTPGVARLSAGLRARFDPKGLFNPGLMAPCG
ncbi:FAD-binding protein [Sulfitobacter sp. M57]|uniref:FAD-binding protein n=1 Tax=unclassified Sulfitobacter TaxID=196795 RepID=UPI0023E14C8E|nr:MULTISPECIES: FAD-binding protein [unclassified Sulfitobacter]MDF3414738.1 FAD-binding protein [Sulfitobacter sp. KE5]MDF3422219.1 FAD-binding protein [Sulfitobacter sp. KE43]MDF3433284.1 FAD-binding protein [Sulfitobacter sp. KE42]MDF3458924.1 FAD-binding protein [Sulfitobacter sp. S74]MDF3462823.1 FAD-binding protein [Sulfitobacter sp. Ks18]